MRPTIPVLLLLCAALPAQRECLPTHDDGTLVTNTTTGGVPIAYKLTAPSQLDLVAAQVHTGLRAGGASVAVWDHDPVNNQPNRQLTVGSYTQRSLISWQGATFPQVTVQPGQDFWLVWDAPNSSRVNWSTDPNGTIFYRGFINGAWNGPATGWGPKAVKIRLYCAHAPNTILTYGTGQAGSGGIVPTLTLEGYPVIGNTLEFVLQNAQPATLAPFGLGFGQTSQPLPGLGTLLVSNPVVLFLQTSSGRNPGTGAASVELRTPNDPAIAGLYAVQYWVLDPGAATGWSHTDGLAFVLQ